MLTRHRDRARTRESYGRETRKVQTRQALLDAALDLVEAGAGFSSLSLREITRAVGVVPAAFYRHFPGVDELGLAVVEESMTTLRRMLREPRETPLPADRIIGRSVELLARHVRANRRHFRFIASEMHGGNPVLRERIGREIQAFTSELALDLGRLPFLNKWSAEDLRMIAGLMVNAMVLIAAALLEVPADQPQAEAEVIRMAEKQLLLISLGVPQWKPAAVGLAPRAQGEQA